MYTIKTPATSANVGPGFDCLGLALELNNVFHVKLADTDILENVEERFNNQDNLFLQSYRRGCEKIGVSDHIHTIFQCNIPVSRGLGSSSSLIVGGLIAASVLHNHALTKQEVFQLAAEMEGHPDNVAPCIFGGLTASSVSEEGFESVSLSVHLDWKFTVFIPDFEVSTEKARGILPQGYPRSEAAANTAHAIMMLKGLADGNERLIRHGKKDCIHEPYRRTLLPFFDSLQNLFETDTDGILLISGSGSTCIGISKKYLSEQAKQKITGLEGSISIRELPLCLKGASVL